MSLQILSNDNVNKLLHSFTKDDILALQESLADALHWYSTSSDGNNDCCSDYQPEQTTLKRKDGSTTVYLPASGITGQGVKVLNIAATSPEGTTNNNNNGRPLPVVMPSNASGGESMTSTSSSSSITTTSTSASQATTESTRNLSLRPKSEILDGTVAAPSSSTTSKGSLTLFDNEGNTVGLINAEEITAFRTALASTMLFEKRQSVHDVTIFGAGKQAYWHARLALLLRGEEIHHMNFVTHNFESAHHLLTKLYNPQPSDPTYINPIGTPYNSKTKKEILTPAHTEYTRLLKQYVRASNIIFCCTPNPSPNPLFPATYLTNPEGRKKGRYIACVGSYTSHMVELHPDVLRYAVAPHHEHRHVHKRQKEGGAILVDSVEACLKFAGEVVKAGLSPDQVVELGEIFMLKRERERLVKEGKGKGKKGEGDEEEDDGCHLQENSGLKEWLTRGNVIYKSVGLGLMDVVVGNELLRISRERGVGMTVEEF